MSVCRAGGAVRETLLKKPCFGQAVMTAASKCRTDCILQDRRRSQATAGTGYKRMPEHEIVDGMIDSAWEHLQPGIGRSVGTSHQPCDRAGSAADPLAMRRHTRTSTLGRNRFWE